MGLSKLSGTCNMCPNVDHCDHKRMEALGYLPSTKPSRFEQINQAAAEIEIDGMSLSSDLYKSLGKQLSSALAR